MHIRLTLLASPATLALAAAALFPSSAQADDSAPSGDPKQDIVVTGQREAQRAAIAEKRDALNFVEALHANDVGKLPDQNVAEAIKRLPGLSVANDQGEGRYIIIRGINPSLVNVTLNNQTLPAPEPDGRNVKLDDLPSAMIQSVTITKSLLASQDANAIGGEVNIRTKSAFDDPDPFFVDARATAGYYDMNHKSPYELDGTVGGRFGADQQFGAVVSVNYSRRPIESENYRGSEDFSSSGVPDGNGLRDYNLVRKRLGVVGNFDWHPSDSAKIYLRTSYSKFEDDETRDQNRLAVTGSSGNTLSSTGTILVRRRQEDDNTKSATLGGEFDLAGGQLQVSGGWIRAEKTDPLRSEFTFTTKKGTVTAAYDASTNPYTLSPTGTSTGVFDDPSKFSFSKFNLETRQASERIWQGRVDYSHPLAIGDDSSFQFGFKYLNREKLNNRDKTDYKAGSTAWSLDTVGYAGDDSFYDMFHFGQRIDYDAARAYLAANPSVAKIDDAGTLADSLSSDYRVREEITAGYVMATLKTGGLTLVPGLRVEHTFDRTAAKVVDDNSTFADDYNSFGKKSYTDLFPSLNARAQLTKNLIVRGAVTTSIGRPNYPDLAPYINVSEDHGVTTIALGNPDLKPYRAINYDLSVEYYPTRDTTISTGFFHKDISNPIYTHERNETNTTYAGVEYDAATIDQVLNADRETLSGVEFNLVTQFTFLPGVLSGFGVSANYTHVWGHANDTELRSEAIPLFYQSRDLANVQLFYEKYGVAARLAFNYRSSYLDTLGTDANHDEYTDGNGQLDLHLSYQVTPQFTVFGDAINLTDAPWRRYIGSKQYLVEREQYGTQLRAGVQMHF